MLLRKQACDALTDGISGQYYCHFGQLFQVLKHCK